MTKKFEEIIRGDIETIRGQLAGKKVKGELTLVVQGKVRNALTPDPSSSRKEEQV
jgi:16S rRNA C1402 (ribose-2'-O) methylase RsmI